MSPPHLKFTQEEEDIGNQKLRSFGLPMNAKFVCLIVRDSAYLDSRSYQGNWDFHNYRDTDIQTYVMAIEELANMGYYVFRMGAVVGKPMGVKNSHIIDYAINGMRNDFMDIYLGAKCDFCISVGTGFDAVPSIFRRPIVYANMAPIGYFATWSSRFLLLTQHHYSIEDNRELSLIEIINRGAILCYSVDCYNAKNIKLMHNTPEEIHDQVVEMAKRLEGTWISNETDNILQERFWNIFPDDIIGENGQIVHGKINALFGSTFLRNNPRWLK
jgi:putative glycosyltransferase (TIGR04372 family)